MGTCCSNNEWPLGASCAVHREQRQEKNKRVAFEGLTFICGTMSHFRASHRQLSVCAPSFSGPRFCKMQMDLSAILSHKEKNEEGAEALLVCHHTMTFLLISGPEARQRFKC